MRRLFNEWWSTQRAKNPGGVVIGVILLFNLVFLLVAAAVISALSLDGTEHMGFLEAAFCTMVPVEDFTVVSLFLQESGEDGELYFDVTELFDYGTLTPDRPLSVTLTIYGTMPSYGISFTDPSGIHHLYGVTMSGMDGSLELMEIN